MRATCRALLDGMLRGRHRTGSRCARAWRMGVIIAIVEPRNKSDKRCLALVFP